MPERARTNLAQPVRTFQPHMNPQGLAPTRQIQTSLDTPTSRNLPCHCAPNATGLILPSSHTRINPDKPNPEPPFQPAVPGQNNPGRDEPCLSTPLQP